jgi:hypothetical protein
MRGRVNRIVEIYPGRLSDANPANEESRAYEEEYGRCKQHPDVIGLPVGE